MLEGFSGEIPRSGGGRLAVFLQRMAPGFCSSIEQFGGFFYESFFVRGDEQGSFGELFEDGGVRTFAGQVASHIWNEAGNGQAADGSLRGGVEFA